MTSALPILLLGTGAGFLALFLITGDLARNSGMTVAARALLAAGMGAGVIGVALKLLLVALLMDPAGGFRPAPRPALRPEIAEKPGRSTLSTVTGPWRALPARAPFPDGVAPAPDLLRLGQKLFNEPGLSADGTVACSSCHRLDRGGDDDAPVATGVRGQRGPRNAPTVWNAGFLSRLFWDGRAASLEDQALGPLVNPVEMGLASPAAVEAALRRLPGYAEEFASVFGTADALTIGNIAYAIASYERTLIGPDTAYDRFVRGDPGALSAQQIRGMALFAGLGCRGCHRDPTFSAAGRIAPAGIRKPFPLISGSAYVAQYDLLADPGAAPESASRRAGLWRVPSLRNVADTAPYFHNGAVTDLEEAVRVMVATQVGRRVVAAGGEPAPEILWDGATRRLTPYRPRVLVPQDIAALAAFLRGLSDDTGRLPASP